MQKIQIDLELVKQYYLIDNLTAGECAKKLNISLSSFKRFIKKANIVKSKDMIYASIAKHNLEIYGCKNVAQLKEVQQKMKQTCLDKYGVNNASKTDFVWKKIKQTNLEKYGVEFATQSPIIKEKSKQTCLNKYGVEFARQAEGVKEKIKLTVLAKYGVDTVFKSKEIRQKVIQTNLATIGVPNQFQAADFKYKAWKRYRYDNLSFDSAWELALYIYAKDNNEFIIREPIIPIGKSFCGFLHSSAVVAKASKPMQAKNIVNAP